MELTDQQAFTIKCTSEPVGVIERAVVVAGTGDAQLEMSIDDSGWISAGDVIAAPSANTFVAEPGFSYRWAVDAGASVYVSGANIEVVE